MERQDHRRARQLPAPRTGRPLESLSPATELRTGLSQRERPNILTTDYPSRLSLADPHRLQVARTLAISSACVGGTLRPDGSWTIRPHGTLLVSPTRGISGPGTYWEPLTPGTSSSPDFSQRWLRRIRVERTWFGRKSMRGPTPGYNPVRIPEHNSVTFLILD